MAENTHVKRQIPSQLINRSVPKHGRLSLLDAAVESPKVGSHRRNESFSAPAQLSTEFIGSNWPIAVRSNVGMPTPISGQEELLDILTISRPERSESKRRTEKSYRGMTRGLTLAVFQLGESFQSVFSHLLGRSRIYSQHRLRGSRFRRIRESTDERNWQRG